MSNCEAIMTINDDGDNVAIVANNGNVCNDVEVNDFVT